MASTVYARRVQELKLRISRTKDPSFQTIYNAFDELCGCKRLSRDNIIWARKKLVEFRDRWTDDESGVCWTSWPYAWSTPQQSGRSAKMRE
jgi:hypothetical protein